MDLTPHNKRVIDDKSLAELQAQWDIFEPKGAPLFRGETREYWIKRTEKLKKVKKKDIGLMELLKQVRIKW